MKDYEEFLLTSKSGKNLTEILDNIKSKEARADLVLGLVKEYINYEDLNSTHQIKEICELLIIKYTQLYRKYGYLETKKRAKEAAKAAL